MNTATLPYAISPVAAVVDQLREANWVVTLPGESLTVRVRSEDVGNRYTIMDSIVQPATSSPLHYHAEEEIFRVLEGVATFMLDGKLVDAGPDTVIVVPAGMTHAWKNASDKPVRLSTTFIPGGIERLFEQMGGKSPEELGILAQTYGTVIVGPPLA